MNILIYSESLKVKEPKHKNNNVQYYAYSIRLYSQ